MHLFHIDAPEKHKQQLKSWVGSLIGDMRDWHPFRTQPGTSAVYARTAWLFCEPENCVIEKSAEVEKSLLASCELVIYQHQAIPAP
jgi:hypothetical protein